jgi:hypothetical protein
MLTTATIGMAAYGAYTVAASLMNLIRTARLEIWVDLSEVLFGLLLMLAAAFVRVVMPGGLALAMGAMLGLQALALHDAAHLYGGVALAPQLARAAFTLLLVILAWLGGRKARL